MKSIRKCAGRVAAVGVGAVVALSVAAPAQGAALDYRQKPWWGYGSVQNVYFDEGMSARMAGFQWAMVNDRATDGWWVRLYMSALDWASAASGPWGTRRE